MQPMTESPTLNHLGVNATLPTSPEQAQLDRVPKPNPELLYCVRFTCPEFTSLCPVTGQPDFAHLVIDYIPKEWIVESKSLKLYLVSFRNHGAFHEQCTTDIALRLIQELRPHWLRIAGYWYPRGGIPIDVFYQTDAPPTGVWIPEPGVASYRGRG
jgi:7-cyano-7-deazaguanine reductase